MKSTFILNLPINEKDLAAAEEYTRDVVYADLHSVPGEHAQRICISGKEGITQTCIKHVLRGWLDESLQALLGGASLRFTLCETRYPDHTLHQTLFSCSFPELFVYVFRRVESAPDGYYASKARRIDVVGESTQALDALGEKLPAKLSQIISQHPAEGVELLFDLYVDSNYELANEYILSMLTASFRRHLVYFYKSLLVFQPRWKERKPAPQRPHSPGGPEHFPHVVRNYEELKLFTAFLSLAPHAPAGLREPQRCVGQVFREGVLFKRGEGPLDFKWRERYFVLFADRLVYLCSPDAAEERGHLELRGLLLGGVGAFDGMAHAFLLEQLHTQRKVWIGSADRQAVLDWRRQFAELLLGQSGDEPLSDGESLLTLKLGAKAGRHAGSAVNLPEQPLRQKAPADAQLVAQFQQLRGALATGDKWLYYRMKTNVKLAVLNWAGAAKGEVRLRPPLLALAALVVAWLGALPWRRLSALFLLAAVTLAAATLFALWRRRNTLVLRGSLMVERPQRQLLAFLGNPLNLQAWSTSFHRLELKALTRFEASYRVAPHVHSQLVGQFGTDGNDVLIAFGDARLESKELLRVESVPNAEQLSRLTFCVQTRYGAGFPRMLREAEERVAAVALVDGEIADREKRRRTTGVRLGVEESEQFYLQGCPFYAQQVNALEVERQQLHSLLGQRQLTAKSYAKVSVQQQPEALQPPESLQTRRLFLGALFESLFFRRPTPPFRRLPPRLFGAKSLFAAVADVLSFCPVYLALAAAEPAEEERMRLVLTALLGGLTTLAQVDRLPLVPRRGETFQGFWCDGTSLDFEQLDDDTTAFFVESGRQEFRVTGRLRFQCDLTGNAVRVKPVGVVQVLVARSQTAASGGLAQASVTFDCFDFSCPAVVVTGLFFGSRGLALQGGGALTSRATRAVSEFALSPGHLSHKSFKCAQLEATAATSEQLAVSGEWPLCIMFGHRQYWQIELLPALPVSPANRYLPSDIRCRKTGHLPANSTGRQAAASHFEEAKKRYLIDIFRKPFK